MHGFRARLLPKHLLLPKPYIEQFQSCLHHIIGNRASRSESDWMLTIARFNQIAIKQIYRIPSHGRHGNFNGPEPQKAPPALVSTL